MLHLLVVFDRVGAVALADWKMPEDEEAFDQEEADVLEAVECLDADIDKRGPGPWLVTGSWSVDPCGDGAEFEATWRRLTAEEAVRWCADGRLWPRPDYMIGA